MTTTTTNSSSPDVHDRGFVDVIRVEIPAVVFGRWAAHPSVDYTPADALSVDGGANLIDPQRTGWVVTHVATGRSLPADVVDGLSQDEAEAIAHALEGTDNDATDFAFDAWNPGRHWAAGAASLLANWDEAMRIIAQIVYATLHDMGEDAPAVGGAP